MRRALGAGLCVAAAIFAAAPATAGTPYPERLLVTADEWNLALSRTKLAPGKAIVELHNRGEDAHDLKIKRRGRKKAASIPETGSEQTTRIETRFRQKSRYVLWCSLPGHRALGMKAKLRTSKR